ncbi:hypothetical protein JZ751_012471 [Albula glossodonta]|uniref:Bicarbonate transporter-like transmembrane domain-containing protein n=1 Tax=Albula glossodonta TaxID=121402 RepID=A0A8T2NUG5_9TELE|nr:hypothetical protein JZ751_012471 [Albula glossodonta]
MECQGLQVRKSGGAITIKLLPHTSPPPLPSHVILDQSSGMCKDFLKAGRGIYEDLCRRLPLYPSDFTDGVLGSNKTLLKYVTTAIFLYIAILLPAIAFGSLNDESTRGEIDVQKTIIGQSIGGVIYSLFAGSPLVIPLTTAPLAIFISVIRGICDDYDLDFSAFYACIGLWNSLFLILGGVFNVSLLMKLFKRSTEEVIALFISIAFVGDAVKGTIKIFHKYYHAPTLVNGSVEQIHRMQEALLQELNDTHNSTGGGGGDWGGAITLPESFIQCTRERPVLCLLLMLGTLWLGYTLYQFKRSPFLHAKIREVLSDCALPISVLIFSFIGSYLFNDIELPVFNFHNGPMFNVAPFEKLSGMNILSAMGLGFLLALLIFIDQNIVVSLTNAPENSSAVMGVFRSPHGPIVKPSACRRLSAWIPKPVLYGLFLYIALTSIDGNQMCDRMALLLKEQNFTNFTRHNQKKTLIDISKDSCANLILRVLHRNSLLPRIIEAKYLDIIDAQHM